MSRSYDHFCLVAVLARVEAEQGTPATTPAAHADAGSGYAAVGGAGAGHWGSRLNTACDQR
ncbi:hypothetical protein GCM10023235_67290 [Kitasatospora terrestris]|uniref:Uncharacterized protein n=1 Tax=Kitasatospora terrestris TaxID=258051 RepID=A0ABP9EHE3_9ACTN